MVACCGGPGTLRCDISYCWFLVFRTVIQSFSSGQFLIPDNFDLFSLRVIARVNDITRVVKDSTRDSLPQTNETLLVNVLGIIKCQLLL